MTGAGFGQTTILWPATAFAGLVFVVWARLVQQRMAHLKRSPPAADAFASGESAMRYFRPVEMPANNLANLFEMPVLFLALVPLLLVTGLASGAQIVLAWAYVAVRALHSFEHVTRNRVKRRFMAYLGSCTVLIAMWLGFAVDVATR